MKRSARCDLFGSVVQFTDTTPPPMKQDRKPNFLKDEMEGLTLCDGIPDSIDLSKRYSGSKKKHKGIIAPADHQSKS